MMVRLLRWLAAWYAVGLLVAAGGWLVLPGVLVGLIAVIATAGKTTLHFRGDLADVLVGEVQRACGLRPRTTRRLLRVNLPSGGSDPRA